MPLKIKKTQKEHISEPHGRDLFQTPNYAVDLLIPFIPKNITHIWECAAGHRKISNRLEHFGYSVFSSDIDMSLENVTPANFIMDNMRADVYRHPTAIITNPPYSLKKKFYKKCMEYKLPFALLIPADYSFWVICALRDDDAEKIIPDHRINFITPTGKSEVTGHSANYHSLWLTHGLNLGKSETFVELTKEMRKNI